MKIGRFLDSSPSWEDEDPAKRLRAIAESNPPQQILESIAATDNDQSVRLAAIDRLENPEYILDLAHASDGEQRRRAAARWTALVCENETANTALSRVRAPAILAEFAKAATTIELRLQAVSQIDDDEALFSVLGDDNHSRVYQACAERTSSESQLEAIKKRFIDKDKGVHQIAKDRLASMKAARDSASKQESECEEICTALESLAANQHETALARRLEVLELRWKDIAATEAANAFRERAESAMQTCHDRIAAEHAEKNAARESAAAVIAQIDALEAQLADSENALASLPGSLESVRASWPAALGEADEEGKRYHRFVAAAEQAIELNKRLDKVDVETDSIDALRSAMTGFSWPAEFAEPAKAETARMRLAELIDANEQEKAHRDQRISTTRNQLAEFEKKIEEGNLKGSNKAHSTIAKALAEHSAIIPRDLRDEFNRLSGRLTELRDWHRFVTNPKRQELCEQMEALATDAEIHPPKKAKEIKALQETWKGLGPSDNREAQELWSRFKAASDNAYRPCAEFFEQQKTVRADNMKAREAICEELEAFNRDHDWTKPDYKALGGLIAGSLRAWREAGEIPRAKFKKVSDRFTAALEPLQERLAAEHERNRQQKSGLIDRVAGFADDRETPLPQLIESTKQAQREWQDIGPAERRKEQKLWKSFRKECDRLFARRDEERTEAKKEANTARDACGQIIDRLKKRISAGDIERGEIRQFRAEFDEAAKQAGKGSPRKAFQGAVKQAERVIEQRAAQGRRLEIDELRRRADLCRGLEAGELDAETLGAEWEGDVELSAALAGPIEERRMNASSLTDDQRAQNLEKAAMLCVRAEILAGIESPEEAQPLRMQYQVERLNRELSQGQKDLRSPPEQLRDLQVEWFCLGGLPSGNEQMLKRFADAETKLSR